MLKKIPALVPNIYNLLLPRHCAICHRLLGFDDGAEESHGAPLCVTCLRALAALEAREKSHCHLCSRALSSEDTLCMRCRETSWSFEVAHLLYPYAGRAASLVSAYKIRGMRALAPFIAAKLAKYLREKYPDAIIVPVPFRRKKIIEKGWDQIELLASLLEKDGFTVARILKRISSVEQKKLKPEDRLRNAQTAYKLKESAKNLLASDAQKYAVLLDDVFTTGATANACAQLLKNYGFARVSFLGIAVD